MKAPRLSPSASPVAREVYRRMTELGLGPKSLSLRAGLNETYARDLFVAKSVNPKADQLAKLADALNCEVADLLLPNRGPAGSDAGSHDLPEQTDQLGIVVSLWTALSPDGRRKVLHAVLYAIPRLHRNAS